MRVRGVALVALAVLVCLGVACSPAAPSTQTPSVAVTRAPVQATAQPAAEVRAPVAAASPAAAAAPAPACCSTGGNRVPNGKPYDSTFYENPGTNPFVDTLDDHLSTFGMDVDTAAYAVARRYLADGHVPDPASVRVEEYVNAFNYNYEQPPAGQDFGITIDSGASPFNSRNELVQIGINARAVDTESRKPANLSFVIDTSGSMGIETRLNTVKQALRLLVDQMRPDDRIGIVSFGSTASVLLQPTPVTASNKQRILSVVDGLSTSGSTSIDAGLNEGFRIADAAYQADHVNMLLLCTDGVANNGVSDADGLLSKYRRYLDKGIQLSTFGFGMGNYNDVMLEKLGNHGNGSYAYIDTLQQARRVFVDNLTGTLQTIARDAKIQVDFNPDTVARYRLLGYEDRDVADNDFRNDRVDGGEVGAGQSVTALYEITRKGDAQGRVATVHIRYQTPDRQRALEQARDLLAADLSHGSSRIVLAGLVAEFAEVLKHSYWARGITLAQVADTAGARLAESSDPQVRELIGLMRRAAALDGSSHAAPVEEGR